jgi:hypothetical protein
MMTRHPGIWFTETNSLQQSDEAAVSPAGYRMRQTAEEVSMLQVHSGCSASMWQRKRRVANRQISQPASAIAADSANSNGISFVTGGLGVMHDLISRLWQPRGADIFDVLTWSALLRLSPGKLERCA